MYEQVEGALIGRVAQLQFLNKSGSFQLSLRQRNVIGDRFNLFEHLNAILKVDLRGYAAGKSTLPPELQQRYRLFERGVIFTRLFSKNKSDVAAAQSIIDSLAADQPDVPVRKRTHQLPVEFHYASWLNLLHSLQLNNSRPKSGHLSMHHARKIFRVLQELESTDVKSCRRFVGLLNFIARRAHGLERKELILNIIALQKNEPELLRNVINFNLFRKIYAKDRVDGLLTFLKTVLFLNDHWPRDSFGQFYSHLKNCSKRLSFFQQVLKHLREMAEHREIAAQVVDLLMRCKSAGDISEVLRHFGSGAKIASIDAQRLCGTIMKLHRFADPGALRQFCKDMAFIGLDDPLMDQLMDAACSDPDFVNRLVMRQLDTGDLIRQFEQTEVPEQKFHFLMLLALQNFRGRTLGDITRGISSLHMLKRTANIDNFQFDTLFADVTHDLPKSLKRLEAYPDGIAENLVCMYTALYIASEQLHSTVDMSSCFNDSYYGMSWFDKGAAMHAEV